MLGCSIGSQWMKSKGLLDSIPDSYHDALH